MYCTYSLMQFDFRTSPSVEEMIDDRASGAAHCSLTPRSHALCWSCIVALAYQYLATATAATNTEDTSRQRIDV